MKIAATCLLLAVASSPGLLSAFVTAVLDVAAASAVFARRQQLGEEAIGYAHQVKIEALARLGELLRDMPKATGAEGVGKSKSVVPERYRTQSATLADLHLTKKTSAIAQQLAALPDVVRSDDRLAGATIAPHPASMPGRRTIAAPRRRPATPQGPPGPPAR